MKKGSGGSENDSKRLPTAPQKMRKKRLLFALQPSKGDTTMNCMENTHNLE